jgi:predicted nucleotidyltransferase
MAVEVKLGAIIEALELADESISSYLNVETGEVHSISEEEFDLAEDPQTAIEDLPDWQREAVEVARNIQQHEGKRYLALPDKFDVHEWAIMDRFSESLKDARLRNDFHGAIRGAGAFRLFKRLLSEYNLWDAWNRFKEVELRQIAVQWCEEHGIVFRQAQP